MVRANFSTSTSPDGKEPSSALGSIPRFLTKKNKMKYLILFFAVALFACTKPQPVIYATGDNVCFYKITEVDINGKSTSTPVRRISFTTNFDGDEHDEDDDDDDDDDHDGCDTTVLPINISSFLVTLSSPSTVLIKWESQNEENTSYYIVEKSIDLKSWMPIAKCNKSLGAYSVKDVISK